MKKNRLSWAKLTGFSPLGYTMKLSSLCLLLKQHIAFITSETAFPIHKIGFDINFLQVVLFFFSLSCVLWYPTSLSSLLTFDLISSTFLGLGDSINFRLKNTSYVLVLSWTKNMLFFASHFRIELFCNQISTVLIFSTNFIVFPRGFIWSTEFAI